MEKIVRVTCKLPQGVIVKIDGKIFGRSLERIDAAWADFLRPFTRSMRVEAPSVSLELTLELPAGLERAVAEALSGTARELRGGK